MEGAVRGEVSGAVRGEHLGDQCRGVGERWGVKSVGVVMWITQRGPPEGSPLPYSEDHLDHPLDQLLPQHPVRVPTTEVGGEQADG